MIALDEQRKAAATCRRRYATGLQFSLVARGSCRPRMAKDPAVDGSNTKNGLAFCRLPVEIGPI